MDLRALTDADRDASWELDADAFHVPDERRDFYQRHFVPERFVGVFDAGRLVAQTRSLPFGQFFGGRSVPMGGLSSVAVAPDARGCGAATRVVHAALRAMRERGELISSLFPATTALYRKLGYEAAGATVWRGVAPRLLAALPEPAKGRVRRAGDGDLAAVRACYERVAPQLNGFVDRPDSWWRNLADVWAERSLYVAQGAAGEVEGYVVYRKVDGEYAAFGGPFQLVVENLVAETRDAALALWRLVGSWSSQAERVVYRGGAEDPLLLLLPEQELKPLVEIRWMTRVVDAAGAVGARGFPAGLAAEVHLSVLSPGSGTVVCGWPFG